MPEGDTVFRTGRTLARALADHVLTRGDLRHPRLSTYDLKGRTVLGVRTVGKHLFLRFDNDLSLHHHLRMDGSWHVYEPDARWRVPGHQVRAVFANSAAQAVGVRLHDMELLPTNTESDRVGHLGPDLLDPEWTGAHAAKASEALAAQPSREIGVALMDQTVMAGVGNLYKAEVCFMLGVSPWTPVSEVDVARAVALSHELLVRNAVRIDRNTTGQSARDRALWVYGQHRRGCIKCGGRIDVADQGTGLDVRKTWYCPHCQRPGPPTGE